MSQLPTLTVITYDVSRDGPRNKVAAMLEKTMTRVQVRVFEGYLSQADIKALATRLELELDEGDSVRIYAVTAAGRAKSLVLGQLAMSEPGDFWLV